MYYSESERWQEWSSLLRDALPDVDVRLLDDPGPAGDVDMALVWRPPAGALRRFPNLRVIFSLGAGVDGILSDATLPDVPLVRLIDAELTRGMTEYVLAAVLRHHRHFDVYGRQQAEGVWRFHRPPLRSACRVGILGLGELGRDAALVLRDFGFAVAGWSRGAKDLPGIACYDGADGLGAFLARTDILVCLLPLTPGTAGILDKTLFAALPEGAAVINVARGGHLVDGDLIAALDEGHLSGATLDVFHEEPLPEAHPFWRHPKILITPHAASYTVPQSAVAHIAANIRRLRAGEPLVGVVDRERGY
ncbi:2-hydroxyacid dehydrogenase [Marinivivus vitaminiproducens]|uniref:2-hydroxyacid dehydrogenase n=1 Tax=Marinivivus vitaminiproducens TaxID=3035935 RepID=UPI00279FC340|nr:glyoxylate/hydroxypyruvate reductase A [Geminicoccaceae bacterium SCSIO 64248]